MLGHNFLLINGELSIEQLLNFSFKKRKYQKIEVSSETYERVKKSQTILNKMISEKIPIYGVTTGFGDSCHRVVPPDSVKILQENLILYLSCGTGEILPTEAVRAMCLIRLNSMARGYSGISKELLDRMVLFLEQDILPQVPCEGSLGASGDLIPLAYYAQILQGKGKCFYQGEAHFTEEVLKKLDIKSYAFKAKEALAIVNGTSTMAGMLTYNLKMAEWIYSSMVIATSWNCMALGGRTEAFSPFINEIAKTNIGQGQVAQELRELLKEECYGSVRAQEVKVIDHFTEGFIQDRYSLRCVPQILGPIREQLDLSWNHLKHEINSVTDNPLFTEDGQLELGGNFYGGYLCQSHDILKINMAHIADLLDRQLAMLIDEKSNRGLPANLIDTSTLPDEYKHCHQGLKGLHQAVSAITAEILQRSIPNGIFSRSSESHNQDKVSMGMGAAMSSYHQLQATMRIMTMHLIALTQALDLRKIQLKGERARSLYNEIRNQIPVITKDTELGPQIQNLTIKFRELAL
jgi:histidine ammonia-lyase/phenylalanine ammonia-lyase